MRSQAATCLFESSRRAEATVFRTRPSLKEQNVDLSFYESLHTSIVLANNNYIIQGESTMFDKRGLTTICLLLFVLALGACGTPSPQASTPTPTPTPTPTMTPTPVPEPAAGDVRAFPLPDGSQVAMVYVPTGTFWMGSTEEDIDAILAKSSLWEREWYTPEQPQHEVYLGAFWIDRTEVTNAMYAACVAAGACDPPSNSSSYTRDDYFGNPTYDDYPVIYVSWDDAQAFCAWSGRRLPKEAEWEKAARGTDGRTYPSGEELSCDAANVGMCEDDTTAVGSHPDGASPYGALDMAGNVCEWVNDWYDKAYYGNSPAANPSGPDSGDDRVVRGGSVGYVGLQARAAGRSANSPSQGGNVLGFRCASSP